MALGLGGVLLPLASVAQITPPGAYEWIGLGVNSTTSDWTNGNNWLLNNAPTTAPPAGADILFGNEPLYYLDREKIVTSDANQWLRSLWFEGGEQFYTLSGTGRLTLGYGLADGGQVITVTNAGGDYALEVRIMNEVVLNTTNPSRTLVVENQSEGGLGFWGPVNIGSQSLLITGARATHLAGSLWGSGGLTVEATDPSLRPTHLVLSGNGAPWSGALNVQARGFAIIKGSSALGTGANTVHGGGTLGFRSHLGATLNYNTAASTLFVAGKGVNRQPDAPVPYHRIGAIYNDGGDNRYHNKIQLTNHTWFGSRGDRSGNLTLFGQITDGGAGYDFVKVGRGLITLRNTSADSTTRNTWGRTIIRDGVLRRAHNNALPDASLIFEGGILELASGAAAPSNNFTRSLGTGTNQVQWQGDGGFSNFTGGDGVTRRVSLNGGAVLTWGQQYFVQDGKALLLSSRYADAPIEFVNSIDLGSTGWERRVYVERGSGKDAYAILSGKLTGSKDLHKLGDGLLWLTNAQNDYAGESAIIEGALRGYIPTDSKITLLGGVLGLDADFARTIGIGTGQIRWGNSGGFAAYGGDRNVTLNGGTALNWAGFSGHISQQMELRFGHYTADGTVFFKNALNLGSLDTRTIRIERGWDSSRADVVLPELISGSTHLQIVGDGRIDLTAANPFSGDLTVSGAELRINQGGSLANVGTITLNHAGTLFLDNRGTHNSPNGGLSVTNRIGDNTGITFAGGTLRYRSNAASPIEKVGTLSLVSGQNHIELLPGAGGTYNPGISAFQLSRNASSRSTLHITGANGQALFLDQSAEVHAINQFGPAKIIPWATFNSDWATSDSSGNVVNYQTLYTYSTGAETSWQNQDNVRLDSALGSTDQTLSVDRTINSLILHDRDLNLNGRTFILRSGGLISSGTGTRYISDGRLYLDSPLYIHTQSDLFISNSDFSVRDVVKSGAGTLTLDILGGTSTLYIYRGTVDLRTRLDESSVTVGDGGGYARLKLPANSYRSITSLNGRPGFVTLHGTPYDPRGPEYGGGQAVLEMGGNTKLHLERLHIENRGMIDWVGGEVGAANILWVNWLTFSGPDARLFLRNWYEFEDILLVKKTHTRWDDIDNKLVSEDFALSKLGQIIFEGHSGAYVRDWDLNYYQIIPYDHSHYSEDSINDYPDEPEPETYGAILTTLGVAVVLWRKRKKTKQALSSGEPRVGGPSIT